MVNDSCDNCIYRGLCLDANNENKNYRYCADHVKEEDD